MNGKILTCKGGTLDIKQMIETNHLQFPIPTGIFQSQNGCNRPNMYENFSVYNFC